MPITSRRGHIVASIDHRVSGDAPVPSIRVGPIYDDLGRPDALSVATAEGRDSMQV